MPTLEEKLAIIEKEERRLNENYPFFQNIKAKLLGLSEKAWNIAIIITVVGVTIFFCFTERPFFSWQTFAGILFMSFMPGMFIAAFIQVFTESLLEDLIYRKSKLTKFNYNKINKEFSDNEYSRWYIEKQIRIEKNKVIERDFLNKLNDAVYRIEKRTISLEGALVLKKELDEENKLFVREGYYFYTRVYYSNRFKKINEAIESFNEPPIEIVDIPKIIVSAPSVKPIVGNRPISGEKKPEIEASSPKVEPFSPTYKPVNAEIPIAKTDIINVKTEVPELPIDKPIVKNDKPSVTVPDKPRPWWNPEKKVEPVVTAVNAPLVDDNPIIETENPVSKTDSTNLKAEVPEISIDKPIVKKDKPSVTVPDKPRPWWNPEKKVEPSVMIVNKPLVDVKPNVKQKEIPIIETNKSIGELFPEKIETEPSQPRQKRESQPSKIDYLKLNEQRKNIGFLGEKFALEEEKKRLISEGLSYFIEDIKHVSKYDDSFGYDIESCNADGSTRYIEVKTTTGDESTAFFITENEMTAMDNLSNYFIYRVYNFNVSSEIGNMFQIDCDAELKEYFDISSVSYLVSPK